MSYHIDSRNKLALIIFKIHQRNLRSKKFHLSPLTIMCCYDHHASPGFACERMCVRATQGVGGKEARNNEQGISKLEVEVRSGKYFARTNHALH